MSNSSLRDVGYMVKKPENHALFCYANFAYADLLPRRRLGPVIPNGKDTYSQFLFALGTKGNKNKRNIYSTNVRSQDRREIQSTDRRGWITRVTAAGCWESLFYRE
jgi:hypothetical protein